MKSIKKKTFICPECHAELDKSDDLEQGEVIVCTDCGIDLEVVSLKPLKVQLAPKVEEDWGE